MAERLIGLVLAIVVGLVVWIAWIVAITFGISITMSDLGLPDLKGDPNGKHLAFWGQAWLAVAGMLTGISPAIRSARWTEKSWRDWRSRRAIRGSESRI